jgi:hypothetical protein
METKYRSVAEVGIDLRAVITKLQPWQNKSCSRPRPRPSH